jgi:hypothetical protein
VKDPDMMKTIGLALMLAGLPLAAVEARAGPTRTAATSAAELLASVRRAVGYERLPAALEVRERSESGGERTLLLGTRHGEVRNGDAFGFDGAYRWRFDDRRGMAVPDSLRNHEKNAWPLWARSYAWLDPRAGFEVSVAAGESDASTIALRLKRSGGLVAATLYVDRATHLPQRLVIPYEKGPFTALYSDYRDVAGVRVPYRVETRYRDAAVFRTLAVAALKRPGHRFDAPPLPRDHRFDNGLPARLEVRRGPDFGPGVPGHAFVRPLVDGRETGWFLVDSGADGMMIDERIADSLGMEVIGRARMMGADGRPREGTIRRGRTLQVGRLIISSPTYLAVDLSGSNAPPGEKRAGVIGYDVFARAVIEFGEGGNRIAVCDPARYRAPARWAPMGFLDQTAAVETKLEGGRRGLFQVDTGFAGSVDFFKDYIERTGLLDGRATEERMSQGASGGFAMRVGRIGWIDLGGRRFRNEDAGFRTNVVREGAAGVVGRGLMRKFTTVFDYPHRRLAFLPAAASPPGESRCR